MEMPLIVLIVQGIPEGISLITMTFVIAKVPLNWSRLIIGGIFLASCSYVLRLLPISFGVHTVVVSLLLILFTIILGQIRNLNIAILSSLISCFVLVTSEIIFLTLIMRCLGITEEKFLSDLALRILLPLPQVFLMFTLSFIIYKVRNKTENGVNL